jgi:O-antigen/teichoic acid export membrane protein
MAAGIAWMSLMRVGVKGLGLLNTVILARLLVPADFGLVAMAVSVIAALELLSAFSFDYAIIQRQDATRGHYDTAWTLNVLFALALASTLALVAYPAADFYNEPRLRVVMQVLAVGMLVQGFENIGVVAFRKELEFRKEFLMRIVQKLCGTAVTLPLAFALRNYWALVIGMVTGTVLSVLISYYAHPFRARFSLVARGHLFSYSKWMLVNNMLYFLRDRTPDFVLGRTAGANVLGLFTISYEIASLPTTELVAPINRAVLPAYAKMAADLETLRRGFLDVIGLVAVVALPAGFGIAATSGLIVGVVLGDKWLAAVPLISILAVVGSLNAVQSNCGNVLYAMGRPKVITFAASIHVASLVASVIWAALYYGPTGIALAYLVNTALVTVPLNYAVLLRTLKLSPRRVLSLFWRPTIGTAVMYAATLAFVAELPTSARSLMGAILFGAAVYVVTVGLLWSIAGRPEGPEKTLVDKFLWPTWRRFLAYSQR